MGTNPEQLNENIKKKASQSHPSRNPEDLSRNQLLTRRSRTDTYGKKTDLPIKCSVIIGIKSGIFII